MIPVIVISLLSSTDRRRAVEQSFGRVGVPFSFFDAVDGKTMGPADIAELAPRPYVDKRDRILTPGEIALAASFRRVLQRFYAGTDPFILIAEDDVVVSLEAADYLDAGLLQSLPNFDVLRLANDPKRDHKPSRVVAVHGRHAVHAPLRPGLFTLAQIFTRDGAQRVIAGMVPLWAPIDNLIYRDLGIVGLRILEVRPAVVLPHDQHSKQSTVDRRFDRVAPRSRLLFVRRKWFILARRLRTVWSYSRAWGLGALIRLRTVASAIEGEREP